MTQQPEALRLAELLDGDKPMHCGEAAAELRRQHKSITTLEAALRQAVEALNDTAYRLEQSRIWGGMEWNYHPMHPVKYLPVRDKAREAATTAKQALGEA